MLILPLIVYGVDALLNFPVARPLMQSSLAIYLGLILSLYSKNCIDSKSLLSKFLGKGSLFIVLILLLPGLYIHILSFISLRQQGRLLYEFNNAQYTFTRDELDKISHDFPNLTETAMPIKAMKARYYYLAGNKDEAFKMALAGAKDNPKIHFGNNLYSTFLLQENKIDSAHYYSKLAFDGLPNNMPHYDMYMRTLAYKKDAVAINDAFNRINKLSGGNNPGVWTIYLRTLALTRSLGDPFSMKKAQEGFNKFPTDENIFQLYRILTYGQDRVNKGQTAANEGKVLYEKQDFEGASKLYMQAIDLDPLQYSHALNCGLSFYSLKDFNNALKYLSIATSSKNPDIKEKSLRFKGLTLISLGDRKGACAAYTNLIGRYPKRMYQQEFVKYCRTK